MAISVSQANAVSKAVYDKTITQQSYDDSFFFKKLKKNDSVIEAGGNDIRYPVRYKKLDRSQDVDWNDQESFEAVDTRTSAVLDWMPYRGRTLITWEERSKNQAGPQQIVKLVEDKSKELAQDMVDYLSTDLFASSSVSGKIIPLSTIVDGADTYAGITVSDASNWAAIEDSSSTQLTRALLNTNLASATFGQNAPNAHITTRALLGAYDNLIGASERWHDEETANMGFPHLTLYLKPVMGDAFQQSTYWYGLDMSSFELWVMKGNNMATSEWKELFQAGFPDSMAKVCKMVCNLVCRRRKTNFKLSALTGT